jgi:hypothetical protein
MEQDIMQIVPGVRYVDLETDRGKPLRPPSPATLARQQASLADWRARQRLDYSGADSDHLADLVGGLGAGLNLRVEGPGLRRDPRSITSADGRAPWRSVLLAFAATVGPRIEGAAAEGPVGCMEPTAKRTGQGCPGCRRSRA